MHGGRTDCEHSPGEDGNIFIPTFGKETYAAASFASSQFHEMAFFHPSNYESIGFIFEQIQIPNTCLISGEK